MWSQWSLCTPNCGSGTRERHRECDVIEKEVDQHCNGATNELSICENSCGLADKLKNIHNDPQ